MTIAESLTGEVHVAEDADALASLTARWVVACCAGVAMFRVAVSGGTTPAGMFTALASEPLRSMVDWSRWHVYFADERAVPPDDPRSNYALLRRTLLQAVAIPAAQVHRMEAERRDLDAAAADYAAVIEAGTGTPPRLDLVLLGLGEDGHTASLFPGTPALSARGVWVTRGRAPSDPVDRLTLTYETLTAAVRVGFLVAGASKRAALRGVAAGTVPAARVRPDSGDVHWFLDAAAADGG